MKQKILLGFCSLILMFSFVSFLPIAVSQEPPLGGDISFEPNIELEIRYVSEAFKFAWLDNTFELKLSIHYDGKAHSLADFWRDVLKPLGAKRDDVIREATESMYEFGYTVSDIPPEIAENVEYLVWKIEDPPEIEMHVYEWQPENLTESPFEYTELSLPDGLFLHFRDLIEYGYKVSHPSKTEVEIKGVKGKTSWNLDPITYSSPTVTVAMDTDNLHWEVWNASETNGWNVIQRQAEANYRINNTVIQIGDGSGTYACSDKDVNVLFETDQHGYFVKNKATLTFGQQDSGYATSHGVNINYNASITNSRIIYGESTSAKLYLYSCSLKATYTDNPDDAYYGLIGYFGTNEVKIYNCIFDKVFPSVLSNMDIYNLAILRGAYGLDRISGTVNQVFLYDCLYLIHFASTSKTIRNVNIVTTDASSKIRYTGGGNPHYLVDVDWLGENDWSFYWHNAVSTSIYRQYTFDLTITYPDGSAVEDANVTISYEGQGGGTVGSWLTDADGEIPTQTLSMGFYNQTGEDTIYSLNPYVIEVANEVSGYLGYTQKLDILEETDLTISLQADDSYIWWTLSLCWIPVAIALLIVAEKRKRRNER